jgi:tetratricopeptide (TPR) repeat protein
VLRALLFACALLPLAAAAGPGEESGLRLFKEGRYEEALAAFRLEAERRPASADAIANVGAALSRLGRFEEATVELERALELGARPRLEAGGRYDLGRAYHELGRIEEAISMLEASLRLAPDDVEAKINLEFALRRRQRPPPGGGASSEGAAPPAPNAPKNDGGGGSVDAEGAPPAGVPDLTREEAERILEAIERRERLALPRRNAAPPDPSKPDW